MLEMEFIVKQGKHTFKTTFKRTGASSWERSFINLKAMPIKKARIRGIIFSTKGFIAKEEDKMYDIASSFVHPAFYYRAYLFR